jgi:hypothetical protein
MATTPSNSGGDDDDDRESVGSGGDEVEEEEGEEEPEGGDSENEEGEGGDEEEEEEGEGGDGDEEQEEAEDFGSQRPEVLKKKPLPPEDEEEEEEAEGGGDASSEEDEVPPTHDARKTAAAPPATPPPPAAKPAATPPPAPVKKKAGSLSQATLVSKLKPTKDRDGKSAEAQADASKGPLDASRPRGGKAATKPKSASAASSGASAASTASAKPNGKQKASSTSTTKPKGALSGARAPKPAPSGAGAAAAKRFEQSDDEEDGVSGEEAEAEASLNRPGEGLAERRPPTLQDTHPDVHMEADAAREREAANTREPASRHSGPPAKQVLASFDRGAAEETAVFKAVGLAHRWYKHAAASILHQHTVGHEGDATPFEVRFVDYVDKGNNNRAAVQKQLLEAQPEKFVALVRISGASASTGGYADNQYHASIPITVVDDESSPDLIRKFKESKPPDSAFGSNPQLHWPLEHKVVELAYAEPNCPLPSCCDPKGAPKGDPKNGPKFVLIPGQNQIPNMEEWTHVSASAGSKRPKGGIEGSKRQKTNQATLPFGAATAAAETDAAATGAPAAPAAPAVAAAASSSGAAGSSSDAVSGQADDPPYKKLHVIPVASAEKTTVTIVPGSNSVVVFEW